MQNYRIAHRFILTVLTLLLVCMPSVGATIYKGKLFSQARRALLAEGWKPQETFGVDSNGKRFSQSADAGVLYQAGFIEVESCSGTGRNFCSFNYIRPGQCLSLSTEGEFKKGAYEPRVISQNGKCPEVAKIP
jgi:hypothetical protein